MSLLAASVMALIAAPLGMRLGQMLRHRISPQTFRLCFFLTLLALGVHLASRGLL